VELQPLITVSDFSTRFVDGFHIKITESIAQVVCLGWGYQYQENWSFSTSAVLFPCPVSLVLFTPGVAKRSLSIRTQ